MYLQKDPHSGHCIWLLKKITISVRIDQKAEWKHELGMFVYF